MMSIGAKLVRGLSLRYKNNQPVWREIEEMRIYAAESAATGDINPNRNLIGIGYSIGNRVLVLLHVGLKFEG